MSLSGALATARSALSASSSQMAVVARNTTGASDPAYSRKIAHQVTRGNATQVVIARASDTAMLTKMIGTASDAASRRVVLGGLESLSETVGDPESDTSIAARIGKLEAALQQSASRADDPSLARATLTRAQELASALNEASVHVEAVRSKADADIATSVDRINDILGRFDTANQAVVKGTAIGADVSDAMDVRDALLTELSEEIGISFVTREGNDVAIYADSGVTLYEKAPREVSVRPVVPALGGPSVNVVVIDGVQVTGAGSPMPIQSGTIAGLVEVRDGVAAAHQSQLNAIARGLIEAFAESDQTPLVADAPTAPGLFTYPGAPAMPDDDMRNLAQRIRVNERVDPDQGGNLDRLRDGGIAGASDSYIYNRAAAAAPGTDAGFSGRLDALVSGLKGDRAFAAAGLGPVTLNLSGFAGAAAGWIEGQRQQASFDNDYRATLLDHSRAALSNVTGVNIDDQTAIMLELEKSYASSAKLLSVVNEMLKTLLEIVR